MLTPENAGRPHCFAPLSELRAEFEVAHFHGFQIRENFYERRHRCTGFADLHVAR